MHADLAKVKGEITQYYDNPILSANHVEMRHHWTYEHFSVYTLGYRPCFSDLHKQLLRMDRQSLRQSYVPQCTNDGKYQTQQCDPMQKKCWCVEEDGTEIEGTRKVGDAHCGKKIQVLSTLNQHSITFQSCT